MNLITEELTDFFKNSDIFFMRRDICVKKREKFFILLLAFINIALFLSTKMGLSSTGFFFLTIFFILSFSFIKILFVPYIDNLAHLFLKKRNIDSLNNILEYCLLPYIYIYPLFFLFNYISIDYIFVFSIVTISFGMFISALTYVYKKNVSEILIFFVICSGLPFIISFFIFTFLVNSFIL